MDPEYAERLLLIYIANARAIIDAGFGVRAAEATFFDVIALVRRVPALKAPYLARIAAAFGQRNLTLLPVSDPPQELIELTAHELQWPELREMAESRVRRFFHGDWTLAMSDLAGHVIDAYAPAWSDREFYVRYSSPTS